MSIIWNVDRIELFFYNAGENRWEMFQEVTPGGKEVLPGQPESFFRAQLQKLLTTVRHALATKKCDEIKCSRRTPTSQAISEIPVNFANVAPRMRKAFQDYCKKALKAEGINDLNLIFALEKLNKSIDTKIPSGSLTNLLSVLPVAHNWDVVGWLHPMSTATARFEPEVYWQRFFVYRVKYLDPKNGRPSTKEQPLPYDVFLQMLASGDSTQAGQIIDKYIQGALANEIPYFDFAKSPKIDRADKGQSKMSGQELALYLAYAEVIDAIVKSSTNTESIETNVYYVMYPVIACGYYHFIQLKVTPSTTTSLRPIELLEKCIQTFKNILSERNEPLIFKESLRELLVQIRLSAFQHYVTAWIADNRDEIVKSQTSDPMAVRCFCELAPHLNEMKAISTKDAVWAHVGGENERCPIRKILKPWAKISRDESEWRNGKMISLPNGEKLLEKDYRIEIIDKKSIKLWLFKKMPRRRKFVEECFAGTNKRRLEEQFDAVKQRMQKFWAAGRAIELIKACT